MANSYELESSPIWMDVKKIIGSGKKPVKFEYRGQLHTEKQDITVLKIKSLDVVRDYWRKIGDLVEIMFQMPLGDYMNLLYPFRTNLEFSIKRIELTEGSTEKEPNSKVYVERYKAVFLVDKNPVPATADLEQYDNESLNNADIVDVRLQLVDRSLEPLRIKTAFGVFRDVTQKQVIRTVLGGESAKVLVDGKPSIDGINIVEPDNLEEKDHIIFRNGVSVLSVPTYLQEEMGGVYSTGIGTYLQRYKEKRLWFVYPVYDTKRFDKTPDDKLIVYALPQDKYPGLDRTYNKDGAVVMVVATSGRRYQDSADVDFMNKGVGFRMAEARSFMKKPVVLKEGEGAKGVRVKLNHESGTEDREDGLNYAPTVETSANPFTEYSRVLGMQVAQVDFLWENSNPELLYPGMPVKYVFLDNNKPVELKGTVVFVHTLTALQAQGTNSNVYKNISTVTLLVEQVSVEAKFKNRPLPPAKPYAKF